MCAQKLVYQDQIDDDDPVVIAFQLYEMQGYDKALSRVTYYIEAAENDMQRHEWLLIGRELTKLSAEKEAQKREELS